MFDSEMVLLVLVRAIHFWVICYGQFYYHNKIYRTSTQAGEGLTAPSKGKNQSDQATTAGLDNEISDYLSSLFPYCMQKL